MFGIYNLVVINLRKKWPEEVAEVLISTVTAITPDDLKAYADAGSIKSAGTTGRTLKSHDIFQPTLVYRYSVDGVKFVSQNMYSGPFSRLDAGIIRFFTAGNCYPVRYNPLNPRQSYLMFSPTWPYLLLATIGLGLIFYDPLLTIGIEICGEYTSNK